MENTKFLELCNAYDNAQQRFETYKENCHLFSIEFVNELKAYFQIPDKQFSLYRINEEGFDLVPNALIHAIRLYQDNYWHFGVGLTVCRAPETLPEELILIHLMFRKDAESFYVKYAQVDQEFKVIKGDSESYKPFFDFLFQHILESYKSSIQRFFGTKTTRKLGFK